MLILSECRLVTLEFATLVETISRGVMCSVYCDDEKSLMRNFSCGDMKIYINILRLLVKF